MRPFEFERPRTLTQAASLARGTGQGQTDAPAQYLAGGTTLVDLMKLDVLRPHRLIDLNSIKGDTAIEASSSGLKLGAFAKMAAVARHSQVLAQYPVIAQSLQLAASAQLRNMAHPRRECPAAHPLSLLPRSVLGGLQQACPGFRVRRDHRLQSKPRRARRGRELYRSIPGRFCHRADRAGGAA